MRQSFSIVGAAFCLSLIATAGMAAPGDGASSGSSQSVTGTQLRSPQEAAPATGGGQTGAIITTNPANQTYPATVGPTGSTQPDATNPNRNQPAGGGNSGKN
jgi:hypothetical protein